MRHRKRLFELILGIFPGLYSVAVHGQDFDALAQGFQQARALSAPKAMLALPAGSLTKGADLSWQFPPKKTPNQGSIASCHDFTAIALLEAAYYRHSGQHVAFSEADLFARTKLAGAHVLNDAVIYKTYGGETKCALGETGWAYQDLLFIMREGVLPDTAGCTSYEEFAKNYIKKFQIPFRESILRLSTCGVQLSKTRQPMTDTAEELLQAAPYASEIRAMVREALQGFSVRHRAFESLKHDTLLKISSGECTNRGMAQRDQLLALLRTGIPVEASVHTLGIAFWGTAKHRPNDPVGSTLAHSVVVVGFQQDSAGRFIFKTRNSWFRNGRAFSPDLRQEDLCRVFHMTTFLTPAEASRTP